MVLARFALPAARAARSALIFPEGGRSRSGRVEVENAAYGVGRIVKALPGCRVLCVYLRGDAQDDVQRPARARRALPRAARAGSSRRPSSAGCAARSTIARQIVARLAELERRTSMIGNDVVDLARPGGRRAARHPRFDARVFAPSRARARSRASAEPERAALGALGGEGGGVQGCAKKLDAATVFSPARFVVRSSADATATSSTAAGAFRVRVDARRRARARGRATEPATPRAGASRAGRAARRRRAERRAPPCARSRAQLAPLLGARRGELEIARAAACRVLRVAGAPRARSLALAPRPLRGLARSRWRAERGVNALEPIRRLAIVNRGEAAMRCIRTVKSLRAREGSSLEVVALYTDVDRDAPFVRHADRALGCRRRAARSPPTSTTTACSRRCARAGADAVWPGWGFVAEDAGVRRPRRARRASASSARRGDAMRALGDKIGAKRARRAAGVPVTPWSGGAVADEDEAARGARRASATRCVLKASRGRRRPRHPRRRARARTSPRRSARAQRRGARRVRRRPRCSSSSMVRGGRHIEVQIAADPHGIVLRARLPRLLGAAPPPEGDRGGAAAGPRPRAARASCMDAARAARARGRLLGVGTVEFLVARRRLPLPRDEPAPPGRARHHRGDHRRSTSSSSRSASRAASRSRALAAARARLRDRGARLRRGSGGGLPARARAASRASIRRSARACASTPASSAGSDVPAAFDSLIAKVIATGAHARGGARAARRALARLRARRSRAAPPTRATCSSCSRRADYRARRRRHELARPLARAARERATAYAVPALVRRRDPRLPARARRRRARNFFADPSHAHARHGARLDGPARSISRYRGESYRLHVFAIGSWRYRVHLDGRVVRGDAARATGRTPRRARDRRPHAAACSTTSTERGLRVEVEGRRYRFAPADRGPGARGHARDGGRARTSRPGDRVEAGQRARPARGDEDGDRLRRAGRRRRDGGARRTRASRSRPATCCS